MQVDAPNPGQDRARVLRFGDFELRTESGELFHGAVRVQVQEQSLQVLLALLERPGRVVGRDELQQRLWPDGTHVDFEHGLNAAVKRLRAALEDDAASPRYIETLPRRGYRLVASVAAKNDGVEARASAQPGLDESAEPSATDIGRPKSRRAMGFALLILAVLVVMAVRTAWERGATDSTTVTVPVGTSLRPSGGEADELYRRSLTYKLEPPANAKAIELLERATALRPGSARTWSELARRYHFEYTMAGGGQGFLQKARDANRRALELDPGFSPALVQQVTLDTEAGELGAAYKTARAMVRSNPRGGDGHFALSYVLRYGGMYEDAARECDTALKLDPSNPLFRSCSIVYVLLNRPDHAAPFLDLDPLSTYVIFRRLDIALAAGDRRSALALARSIRLDARDYPEARLIEDVLSGAREDSIFARSHDAEAIYDRINLSEGYFVAARYQAWAGQAGPALRLLRRAISNNYCSYPVIDSDPMLASVRRLEGYRQLRQSAITCRERFEAEVRQAR